MAEGNRTNVKITTKRKINIFIWNLVKHFWLYQISFTQREPQLVTGTNLHSGKL